MSNAGKLIVVLLAGTGGVTVAQTVGVPGTVAPRFDPFRPELSLDAPLTPSPSTQPAYTTDAVQGSGTITPGGPIIRDPVRPPTRSPFRP